MLKNKTLYVFEGLLIIGIIVVLYLSFVSALTTNNWYVNTTINTSLPDIGSTSSPNVFLKDGSFYLLAGTATSGSKVYGYLWSGTNWILNSTINRSLAGLGYYASFSEFHKDSSDYLIIGQQDGEFGGYVWNGTDWIVNSTIINGISTLDLGSRSKPSIFYKDTSWYMLVGDWIGDFHGYAWNGSAWKVNLTINTSLPDIGSYSTPSVFYKDSSWYMISGEEDGKFFGYVWNTATNSWNVNLTINASLPDVGAESNPTIFNISSDWYLISGRSTGNFYGYSYYVQGADIAPPTYNLISTSNTKSNREATFSINVTDDTSLTNGGYIFSTNNTGTWVNSSFVTFSTNPSWINVSKWINSSANKIIGYQWYLNDSLNNKNSTLIYNFNSSHYEGTYLDSNFFDGYLSSSGITNNNTYFWITEYWNQYVYIHLMNGTSTNTGWNTSSSGNIHPTGITQNGTFFWVVSNDDDEVYIHSFNGTYTGNHWDTASSGNEDPYGITQNGTFFWITDGTNFGIYKYFFNGTYTGHFFNTSVEMDSYSPGVIGSPIGITQNGTFFWITDGGIWGVIYKYFMNETYTGRDNRWDSRGMYPWGITQNGTFFWTVDLTEGVVNKFEFNLNYVIPPADSCTYSSGNWNILFSDYCNITSPVDVAGNNITISGIGKFTTTANITGWNTLRMFGTNPNDWNAYCINGGCFK
jgi:hypothetical protein